MRSLALALATLLVARSSDACPAPHLVDILLTSNGATLLDDGGLVIETRNGDTGLPSGMGGLRLTSGGKDLAAQHDYIAPGLSVLRPPRDKGRSIRVTSENKVVLEVTQGTAKAAHAAPKVTKLTSTLARVSATRARPKYGVPTSSAELTLAEAPAEDVLAIVVYSVTKHGTTGIAWFPRKKSERVYTYHTGGKGCVPGPRPSFQGETIAVGFIDIHGRSSPLSKPFVVAAP